MFKLFAQEKLDKQSLGGLIDLVGSGNWVPKKPKVKTSNRPKKL
jgi:hypothetical protein